jgi:hypothetical protein
MHVHGHASLLPADYISWMANPRLLFNIKPVQYPQHKTEQLSKIFIIYLLFFYTRYAVPGKRHGALLVVIAKTEPKSPSCPD